MKEYKNKKFTLKEALLMLFTLMIPILNLRMLYKYIVLKEGSKEHINFAKSLIILCIIIGPTFLPFLPFGIVLVLSLALLANLT